MEFLFESEIKIIHSWPLLRTKQTRGWKRHAAHLRADKKKNWALSRPLSCMHCLSESVRGRWIFHAADPLMELTTEPNWTNKSERGSCTEHWARLFLVPGHKNLSLSHTAAFYVLFCGETNILAIAPPKTKTRENLWLIVVITDNAITKM